MKLLTQTFKTVRKLPAKSTDVDVVYTFVDMDAAWHARFKKFTGANVSEVVRYKHSDEIYFSLKTLEAFFPSVRNIFIVTDKQRLDHQKLSKWVQYKLTYVDHGEIIPKAVLPCFNSMVIEAFLHMIPGVSEVFLYLNDDMFFGNHISTSDIFNAYNVPILYYSPMPAKSKPETDKPWRIWTRNTQDLFQNTFGVVPNFRSTHTAYVMSKRACFVTWLLFEKELMESMSAIRQPKNMVFWYLMYCVGLQFGFFTMRHTTQRIAMSVTCQGSDDPDVAASVEELSKVRPKFMCINNISGPVCTQVWNAFKASYVSDSVEI